MQAETERCRNKPCSCAFPTLDAIRLHLNCSRKMFSSTPHDTACFVYPVVRQAPNKLLRPFFGPWILFADVDVPGVGVLFGSPVIEIPRCKPHSAAFGTITPPDRVVLLTALTAEYQGQQHPFAVIGYKLQTVKRNMSCEFWFGGGINSIATADELVNAEGKHRQARILSLIHI